MRPTSRLEGSSENEIETAIIERGYGEHGYRSVNAVSQADIFSG